MIENTASETPPLSDPFLTYLDELVAELRTKIPAAVGGEDADAVHDARVATRRLGAAAELLQSVTSKKVRRPIEKSWKQVRKSLGAIRDLDVMLAHLDEFAKSASPDVVNFLKDQLGKARGQALARAQKKIAYPKLLAKLETWPNLRKQISNAGPAIDSLLADAIHLRLEDFADRAEKAEHVDPHGLRIAGKSLRYTLELAEAKGIQLPRGVLSHFKKMQDALGLWHDMVVLAEYTLKIFLDGELALHGQNIAGPMINLAGKMHTHSRSEWAKFQRHWHSHGREICRKIRAAFPLTTAASGVTATLENSHANTI